MCIPCAFCAWCLSHLSHPHGQGKVNGAIFDGCRLPAEVNGNHPGTSITIHKQSITHTPISCSEKNPGTFHSRTPSGFKAVLPTLALLQILKVCCEPSLRSPRPILQIFVVSWAKKHKAAEHHLAQNLVPAAAQMPQFPYQNCWTLGP